jgi:hypothetical protein
VTQITQTVEKRYQQLRQPIVILQKTNVPVDVVLGEIDIPGSVNGFGFAQWARSVRPELKIVLAEPQGALSQNAAELCEAGPLLMKPYDHKLVLDRIKAAARGSGAAGSKVTPTVQGRASLLIDCPESRGRIVALTVLGVVLFGLIGLLERLVLPPHAVERASFARESM